MNDEIDLPGAGAAGRPGLWCIGSAVLDEATGCVTVAGQSHELDHSSHELLRHLLRNAGKMALKEDLLQIGWPGRVVSENSLTKSIRRLRQALNDPEGKVLCTVHGYGYRLAARVEYVAQPGWEPAIGDPPPAGELPGTASPPAASVLVNAPTYKHRRRLVALSAVMLALAMILLGTNWRAPETSAKADAPTNASPPSIAVLPFKDLSPDKSQDYMADGITEELTNALAKIPRLRVIGQTTAFSFKGHEVDVMAIGRSLRLTHVLEGSVRISGDRIRVTAQLVRTSDAAQVWSQSYDRNLGDAFSVQDEIAVAVAARLKVQLLGGSTRKHRPDPRAYALVQRSRQIERLGFDEIDSIDRSGPIIRRAVAIDPEYSDAWYILGILYLDEVRAGRRPRAEGVQLARSAYGKSLALNPDNAVVYALMGNLSYFFERDPATATKYFERALSIEPDNIKVIYMGAFLADALGRQDEAIKAIEYSVDLDPVNAMTQTVLGNFYFGAHRWNDSIACYRTALALSPDIGYAHSAIGDALLQIGEPAAALASYKLENDERYRLYGLAVVNHSLGRKSESDASLDTLIEKYGTAPDDGTSYWLIAAALAQRGETDRAFERLADMAIPSNYDFERSVELSSLHTDPRWPPFLRKHGKAPEQLAALKAIKFDFKVPNN